MKTRAVKKVPQKPVTKRPVKAVAPRVNRAAEAEKHLAEAIATGRFLVSVSFVKDGRLFHKFAMQDFPTGDRATAIELLTEDLKKV